MNSIKLATTAAGNLGLDCYPIGIPKGDYLELENAIAVIGFEGINDVFKTARQMGGTVCLFKYWDSDLFAFAGNLDCALYFLSKESNNKLQLIKEGTLLIVGVMVANDLLQGQ